MSKNILSIIICFYPDTKHLTLMNESLKKSSNVLIIDNTPEYIDFSDISAEIILNGENLGIAEAQNIGLRISLERGYKYSILFDQDSIVPENMISNLSIKLDNIKKTACIGPRVFDLNCSQKMRSRVMLNHEEENNLTKVSQIIASGKLINNSTLSDIGLMESELFIDAVDYEWCWRAISKGYNIYIDEDTVMSHVLGESSYNFKLFKLTENSPTRTYYILRNYLLLIRRPYVPLYWKLRNFIILPASIFLSLIFFKGRIKRLGNVCLALRDGVFGKTGKIDGK
ncbi:glycosyltransferase family 2 protein [Proteus mirabilis]|uniref:glycosyltransferase family 2 protein n=1 Tax=Proteus mirabilis TaxID=584 RepID=UPI0034DD402A